MPVVCQQVADNEVNLVFTNLQPVSSATFNIVASPSAIPGTQICYTITVAAETNEGAGLEPSHVSFGVCPGVAVCPTDFTVFLDGQPLPMCNGVPNPCWETNPANLNFCALKVNFADGQLDEVGDSVTICFGITGQTGGLTQVPFEFKAGNETFITNPNDPTMACDILGLSCAVVARGIPLN